ncbi:helix-turn-helix domain-containing protein [Undibacterium sp. Ji42W]|uniref:helix-turn-helix domain-containing protein n=1 Tax=Undibacterium sp. Ji42W TaxID=3413039 RepID=UPI003BF2F7DB
MDIAHRLDLAMKAAGFRDQAHLARESGVPQSTVNRILSGRNKKLDIAHGQALAKACGVSMYWLACGDQDPNGEERIRAKLINGTEDQLVETYRKCSAEGKESILIAAEAALSICPA